MFSWLRSAAKPAETPKPELRPETPEVAAPEAAERGATELESKRKALGVEDALKQIPGVTAPMLIALGENGIKTLEELAGCDVDDLHGWVEAVGDGDGSRAHVGVLDGFGLSREQCGAMIIKARVKVGWIEDTDPTK
jgi:transcription termination/antitermination protein NusA